MVASEIRLNARKALSGKWGKAALTTLVYIVLLALFEFVLNFVPIIGYIAAVIIAFPLSYGFIVTIMKLKRGEKTTYTEFFSNGFNSFGRVWSTILWIIVKLIVPIILIIVSYILILVGFSIYAYNLLLSTVSSGLLLTGAIMMLTGLIVWLVSLIYAMVKYLLYILSFFILYDNPDMKPKEVVNESYKLMKGHRGTFFWLLITFIGWILLASIVFGIGYLWVIPYILVAQIIFYETLAGKETTVSVAVETEQSKGTNELKNSDDSGETIESNDSENQENSNSSDDSGPIKENP